MKQIRTRLIVGLTVLLAAGVVWTVTPVGVFGERVQETPPNIVLIVSDDQGYNDLGSYGNDEIITPHLDRLAEEGVRLTNFYMTSSACTPARGSLLTGRYPQRNGVYELFRNEAPDYGHEYDRQEYSTTPERILGMDTREVLISDILEERGYTNGIFGKWDLGQFRRFLPLQRGFHDFYGFVNTGIDYYTHERYGIHSMYRNNERTTEDRGTYATDLFRRESVRFLKEHADEEPFFLFVPFNAPHFASNLDPDDDPVPAPDEYIEMYTERNPDDDRTKYMAAITAMDDAIGDILNLLDDRDLADNTIVLFMSDHGGGGLGDNSPLRGGKANMFEGGVRAPCIIRWPGEISPGTVSDEHITGLEIFPTLLNIAGAEAPEDLVLDGYDITPVLKGEAESPRTEMYWKFRKDRAVRIDNWKWVDSHAGEGLFNLEEDLEEQNDLSEERPEILERLKTKFAEWEKTMANSEPRRPFDNF